MQAGPDTSYEEFKEIFLGHFWDQNRQSQIRWEVTNGKYDPKRQRSMVDYFINIGQCAKYLVPEIPTGELISMIANHFPPDIRSAIIIKRPCDIPEMMKLLKDLQPARYKTYVFQGENTGSKMSRDDNSSNYQSRKEGAEPSNVVNFPNRNN